MTIYKRKQKQTSDTLIKTKKKRVMGKEKKARDFKLLIWYNMQSFQLINDGIKI